jgi:tetratricopeptide (TPR) repeat protein
MVCFIVSGSFLTSFARQAMVKEEKQIFRTYPFGDPDPVAKMTNIYPYFRFEGYSITPVDRPWTVVTLENPYIKVMIAPEIGGKVLGAIEKSTGKPFIYFNRVVKFREIAMRGPWTSGGIEFNFGDIGHTPSTATPVDYMTRTNEDGSVSCVVGAIDLPSRTEWRVEIRLPMDKAYFETESFWYNPTDLNTSLYHWMNAASDASPDLHLLFPGTTYIDHGGAAFSWPTDRSGRDLSRYANNAFGPAKSYHVLGSYTDWYSAYYSNDDFGVVHWSPYTDKPGKKLWIWAMSREGEIWKNLLTDPDLGNRQYVEIQSGLLFNQAASGSTQTPFKHQFFAPVSEQNFIEAWFPFKDIGGLVEANLSGSLNVKRYGKMLKVGFCPLGRTVQPLTVSLNGKEVFSKGLVLRPLEVFVDSLTIGEGEVEVKVGDLISYKSGDEKAKELQRPTTMDKTFDWSSPTGLWTDGAERAKQRDYKGARERFLACLSKDPAYPAALTGMAEICFRQLQYEEALGYAKRALSIDAYDADANFIYGVIQRTLGNFYDALDGFGVASRSMKYRSAAEEEMAEVVFLQKNWPAAEAYAFRALDFDRSNLRASRLLPVLYRLQGTTDGVKSSIAHLRQIDPLSHMADFEDYLADTSRAKLERFKSRIRNELPHETYLELASSYLGLHRYGDAVKVLELAPTHPIVSYWLAYLNHLQGREQVVKGFLQEATELSPVLVFPFRPETAEILKWAQTQRPHWKTSYYLALIYLSRDRSEAGKELLLACGNAPEFASFYITRGNLLRSDGLPEALKDYKRALELGQNEWRAYRTLVGYYTDRLQYGEALATAKAAAQKFPSSYIALFDLARSLVLNRDPEASLKILDTLTVLPFEGASYSREVYRQACILSAAGKMKAGNYSEAMKLLDKARQWPERLGVGKPYEVDNRLEDYLEALCSEKSGDKTRARKLFDQIVASTRKRPEDGNVNRLFGALSEKAIGNTAAVASLTEEWAKQRNSDVARWLMAISKGNADEAADLVKELRGASGESLLGRPTIDQDFALIVEVQSKVKF